MVYYRCKMNHAPIEVNKYAKEFYCDLCKKFYMKDECEAIKPQKMYSTGMVKRRVPAEILIQKTRKTNKSI